VLGLAACGGLAFWTANLAVSLTSLAADYRSALSIAYAPMLFEAMFAGLIVGLVVSYVLLRLHDVLPGRSSVGQSVLLSFATLLIATGLVEVVGRSSASTDDPPRYFFIGLGLNVVRFLALGVVIGYLRERGDSRAGR
jgi:hypothetical protein